MDIAVLQRLKEEHAGFRLLRAQNFASIASFLWKTFPGSNCRVIDAPSLQTAFEDFVFQQVDMTASPSAQDSIKSWVEAGYLRQYYVEDDDLSRYELTAAAEQALDWVYSLQPRGFIGTESRLKTIFELLEDLREQTEKNIQKRVALLQAERRKIDLAIEKVLAGEIEVLTDLQIRERFTQLEDMARQLLRDFSEVEQNFRGLDRSIRSRIARLDGSRGEVLLSVFDENDLIRQSEQGRSFAAFCEFLMSHSRQEQLEQLLDYLFKLEPVQETKPDPFLAHLQSRLLDASDKVRSTQNQLSAQLRRFLDERTRLENTRINRLIQSIMEDFMLFKNEMNEAHFSAYLDDVCADIDIPTRSLYKIPLALEKQNKIIEADDKQVSASALFTIELVDDKILWSRIRACLETRSPVSLAEVLARFPLEKGLAELVAYVRIASQSSKALVDDRRDFRVQLHSPQGHRQVTVPFILFSR
jgi:hypothetical protein